MDLNELISLRIKVKDLLAELKKSYDEQKAPFDDKLGQLESLIISEMKKNGLTSVNSQSGQATIAVLTKYNVVDFEKFIGFAIANQRFDLFERKVVKSVADEFAEIPGVKMDQVQSLRITRK